MSVFAFEKVKKYYYFAFVKAIFLYFCTLKK